MSLRLTLSGTTHVGRVRARNEDSYALLPEAGLAVVADGVGGHPGGDVASRTAADAVLRTLEPELAAIGDATATGVRERLRSAMATAVLQAHVGVRTRAEAEPALAGMGTTLTALLVHPFSGALVIGHVGDSRAYRFRDGVLSMLTKDDTWVQERVDAGAFTEEQARRHPYANLLSQCVGMEQAPLPQVIVDEAKEGDVYLLCTDGLAGLVEDAEVAAVLGDRRDGEDGILNALIGAANEAGGRDNITAVLVGVLG